MQRRLSFSLIDIFVIWLPEWCICVERSAMLHKPFHSLQRRHWWATARFVVMQLKLRRFVGGDLSKSGQDSLGLAMTVWYGCSVVLDRLKSFFDLQRICTQLQPWYSCIMYLPICCDVPDRVSMQSFSILCGAFRTSVKWKMNSVNAFFASPIASIHFHVNCTVPEQTEKLRNAVLCTPHAN